MSRRLTVGVRVPGVSRVWFYDTLIADIALRDWVAVPSVAGEEPGLVVVAPQQLKLASLPERLPIITRRLSEEEVKQIAAGVERARELLDTVIAIVREKELPVFITGLRFTLSCDAAIVSYRGSEEGGENELAGAIEPAVGVPVHLEHQAGGMDLFGGLGRVPAAMTFHELLRDRFAGVGEVQSFAPEGFVRLGTRVETTQGPGMVVSVATRERRARVRLESGEEVLVPVDSITAV